MPSLTGPEVAKIRKQLGWSQQQLSVASGVTRPYISEYEAGIRPNLPPHMLLALTKTLLQPPAGRTTAALVRDASGHLRLQLTTPSGDVVLPENASVQWTEADGTSYSMFVGRVD